MLTASEAPGERQAEVASHALPSLLELSDDEIALWLSLSILDEPDDLAQMADPGEAEEFWDRVANAEASLAALGVQGPLALDRAIGLAGLAVSLASDPGRPFAPVLERGLDPTLLQGEFKLLQAELVERAGQAIAIWASLRGSALRAANPGKG